MSPNLLPSGLKEIVDVSNMFLSGVTGAVDAVVLKPTALVTDAISSGFNSLANSPRQSPRQSPHGSRQGSPKGGPQQVRLLPPKLNLDDNTGAKGSTSLEAPAGPPTPVKAPPALTVEAGADVHIDPAILSNADGYVDEQIVALLSPLQPGEAEALLVRLLGAMPHLATTVRELRASADGHGTDDSPTGAMAEAAAMGVCLSAGTLRELECLVAADCLGAPSSSPSPSSSSGARRQAGGKSFVYSPPACRLTAAQMQALSVEDKIDELRAFCPGQSVASLQSQLDAAGGDLRLAISRAAA